MRIIKHGELYEIGEKTCPHCKCVFAYNKKDIQTIHRDNEYCADIVVCPECKQYIPIKFKKEGEL